MSAALTLVPVAQIDLAAPDIFISKQTRALIAAGEVESLTCGALPKRNSQTYRIACLTEAEIRAGSELAAAQDFARSRSRDLLFPSPRSLAHRGTGPRN